MAAFLARPTIAPPNYEITDAGNSTMKVVVRLRPENEEEIRSNNMAVAKVLDEHVLVFDPSPDNSPSFNVMPTKRMPVLGRKHKDLRFAFDKVFDETASQMDIFEHTTKSIVDGVLEGINCSVFAYGATGAGKTYTMLGTVENPGVMFLTMMELYKRINEVKEEKTCDVAVSYCEVYNEAIRDLLKPSGDLHLREDAHKGLVVTGLSRHVPSSAADVLSMLESGNQNRTQHPTDANATSSRSHAVFQVFVNQKPRATGLTTTVMQAKMSLIDLAGSERATMTKNRGERMTEGANINRSLLALGNCINSLAGNRGKSVHVPYRDSKLTRLIKDSLGGNCRTVMIANISPSGMHREDTYNTLRYADRAKQIKTKLVPNVLNVDYHVSRYRTIVEELQRENSELKAKFSMECPRDTFDSSEAKRLQDLLKSVYGERSRLRKKMAELDASERETLLKITRKERDLDRINTISGDDSKRAKIKARIESLQSHRTEVQREKQTVNEYLYSNNESVGRVQAEINRECEKTAASPALRMVLEAASEARKLETENAHLWKYSKHLLKYIKNQQKEINKSENMLRECLALVRRQHAMLRASNALTPSLQDMYHIIVRMAEGEKGVAWADQTLSQQSVDNSLMDVSTSTFTNTQMALFDNFVSHASPVRNLKEIQAGMKTDRDQSPSPSTIGILTNSVSHKTHMPRCPRGSPDKRMLSSPVVSMEKLADTNTSPHVNGVSSAKPGTPLFTTTPRTAFTPRNYLKFHPLSENRSHQNSFNFTPLFSKRSENMTSKSIETPRRNGFASPSVEFNPSLGKPAVQVPPYHSPRPVVVDSNVRSPPKPAFLPYTTLAAVAKPRAPTPIDDGSWSSSQSSTYTAKLNSVHNRNGYHDPERRNALRRGQSFQTDSSSGSSSCHVGNKARRPEPYLLPRPHQRASEFRTITPVRGSTNTPLLPGIHTHLRNGINTPLRTGTNTPAKSGTNIPIPHVPVSRTISYNAFEDNFVSPPHNSHSIHVKTMASTTMSTLTEGRGTPSVAQVLQYPTSPSHSPSPPSSSLSSQSLSQDQPSSVLTSNLGSTSSSTRMSASSPVAAVVHSVGSAGSSIPTSTIMFKQPRRVKSPSPLKAYKISPSRRVKSTENLSVRDREEAVASHPVPIKKIASPGKFARAKKLFGIRRNGENTLQSASLTDVSLKSPSPVNVGGGGADMSNPIGVSLSEGDADALNATYIIDGGATKGASNGGYKDRRNGLSKKRGLFNIGNRLQNLNGHHAVATGEKHRAGVEKAHTGRQEVVNGGPTGISRRQPAGVTISSQKMPNYLQLTKAAASKRIGRPVVSKENKGKASESNGKPKASKLLSHRPRDRDLNSGALKATPTPQLVW